MPHIFRLLAAPIRSPALNWEIVIAVGQLLGLGQILSHRAVFEGAPAVDLLSLLSLAVIAVGTVRLGLAGISQLRQQRQVQHQSHAVSGDSVSGVSARGDSISIAAETFAILQASEQINCALIAAIPDLLLRMQRDGTYLYYHCGEEVTLFNREAMRIGGSIFEVLPLQIAEERLRYIEQAFATGASQIHNYELVIQGKIHYEEARIVPYDQHEVLVIVRDVTRRIEAETALRHHQAQLLKAQRLAQMGSWEFDLKTGEIAWSPEMLQMFGMDAAQSGPDYMSLLQSLPPAERQQLDALVNQAVTQGIPYSYEHRLIRADGSIIWLLCRGEVLKDAQGQTQKLLGTSINITERKQIELELQQAKEAAELANQAKTRFLAHMSHELRTPFTIILGYAQLLEQDRSLSADQRQSLQAIRGSGEHLLGLINSILDLSKAESEQMQLEESALPLGPFLNGLQQMFHHQAIVKQLAFHLNVSPDVPRMILADVSKLRQILINLLHNAIKFTEQGSVTLSVIQITTDLIFEVEDTGIGIEPTELQHIFDAFVQTDAGRAAEGTGLGLTISRKFAQLMQGELTATSQIGQGSSFRLKLPLQPTSAAAVDLKQSFANESIGESGNESVNFQFHPIELSGQRLTLMQSKIQLLPSEWRQNLHSEALRCNDQVLRRLIQQIPATHTDLITELEQLVYDYRFDIILQLSQQHIS